MKVEVVFVCIFAAMIITATVVIHLYKREVRYQQEVGKRIYFNEASRKIYLNNVAKETVLDGLLGLDIPEHHLPHDCSDSKYRGVELCLQWPDEASLNITYYEEDEKSCYDIEWESLSAAVLPHDCYHLSGGNWYGGGLRKNHKWPIEKMAFEKVPLLPGNLHNEDTFGPVVERYWLSSLGVAFFVEDDSPLHLSMNQTDEEGQICLYADFKDTIYPSAEGELPKLNYTICVGGNVKDIHKFVVNKIGKPSKSTPAQKYFQKPVWSVGKQFSNYTQEDVLIYAQQISMDKDYSYSMLVLDQGWQEKEGDLDFDPIRFPNPDTMVRKLQNESFDICIAIHPFANTDSKIYQEAVDGDKLVYDGSASAPGVSKWWDGPQQDKWYQGVASSIDVHAVSWWKNKVQALSSKYGNLHFRMNHGDMEYLPYDAKFHLDFKNPAQYSSILAAFMTDLGDSSQVQSAYQAQHRPIIVRLGESNSTWESLQSVIPSMLNAGIIGYPYIMPDTIGGNHVYVGASAPAKELYIRWLQLATFMPIMQFSMHPTSYDEETVSIAKSMLSIRKKFVAPRLPALLESASKTMDPIVRPMWWIDPNDNETYSLDDQFLLGEDVMVAPVLIQSRSRDVYFPQGTWRDENSRQEHTGPKWQRDLNVPLQNVLYFTLMP